MGTYATSTDVATLRTALLAYVSSISHSDSATETVLAAQAGLALDKWADAQLAIINVNASATGAYTNGVGMSVTKKDLPGLEDAARRSMDEFRRACGLGGVTIPSFEDDGIALWDLSGAPND